MAYIEVSEATHTYPNGVEAIKGVSFAAGLGESVAIIGQNGAGKTTLVKMLNGLLKPTSGEVRIDGVSTRERTPAQTARRVGYVFQNPDDQIFNNTVAAEVGYALKRLDLDEAERERRVAEALERCGLAADAEMNPYDLPLSVRKFITLASVLAVDTDVMIFDEPTAGQDLAGLNRIAEIIEYCQARGKIIITITHDMEFVAQNFSRIVVMANGRIVAEGNADAIFHDTEAMQAARLNQPIVPALAAALGHPEIGLDLDQLAEALRRG
ncbi:energy-coupling factor ABC transporter ATP-binding protein [Tessaracoccus oleiagri]|uniref:Energy-coupling factor transport system ATP-binding protein n=1 Tax=Tessaracoccus oleiagri TaxID=686624 RepID=A0A1G9I6J1_9ACTN|nr:ABC transporter ATP-binding protein [Tessaracoccus oleiagri]SDL20858.1 energy-coupling factor transport system ATP-binding protein [Tessaracoccus oleiagri]